VKPEPKQERARIKRAAIVAAASDEFGEHGYSQTTAKSIAVRAGVATGSFYQYFENKDEVLLVIAQQRFIAVAEHLPDPVRIDAQGGRHLVDLQTLFRSVLNFIYDLHARDARLHEVLEQRRSVDPALNALMGERESMLLVRTEQFVGLFVVANPKAIAFSLFAMAEGLVHRHVFHRTDVTKAELIDCGSDMLSAYFDRLQLTAENERPNKTIGEGS